MDPELAKKYPSLFQLTQPDSEDFVESHDGREIKLLQHIYQHPDLDELRGSPSKIANVIDEFAAQHEFLINIGPDKGRIVARIIAEEKPKVFVELGGYIGYSAIVFGDAVRNCSSPGEARLYSIELDPLCASVAMNLVDLAGLNDIVKVVTGSAAETIKRLHAVGMLETIDMLFLDHVEDLYLQEFQLCQSLGLVKSGSMVIADNVVRPGAPEYRRFVRAQKDLDSEGIPGLIIPGDFKDELEVTRVK